jgi:type I restriction enzyme M protein
MVFISTCHATSFSVRLCHHSVFQPYASVATNLLFFTKGESTQKIWYFEHKLPEGYKAYSKTKPIQLSEFDGLKKWWHNRTENEVAWQVDIKAIQNNGYNLDIKNPHQPVAANTSSKLKTNRLIL